MKNRNQRAKSILAIMGFMLFSAISVWGADELPIWAVGSWWEFQTTIDLHMGSDLTPEYADIVATDGQTRYDLIEISRETLSHGSMQTYDVYKLTFSGIVNAEGIYHLEDPFVLDVPIEIRDAVIMGEWWVDVNTLGTVYFHRNIQGPLWAQIIYWQEIGWGNIDLNEEYEPARDIVNFPIEVGETWQYPVSIYLFGSYILDYELFGTPYHQEESFDNGQSFTLNMSVPQMETYHGYSTYRIEGIDPATGVTLNGNYAPVPRTLAYSAINNYDSGDGLLLEVMSMDLLAYELAPDPTPTPTPGCINNGDVNFNGTITAGDAQLAFMITLGAYSATPREYCAADCNANGTVTAGDAQGIFARALGLGSCADPLVKAKKASKSSRLSKLFKASDDSIWLEPNMTESSDQIVIDVVISNETSPVDAFTMDIKYNHRDLNFIGCEVGDLDPGWISFGCNEITDQDAEVGIIRVAAFSVGTEISPESMGTLAHLVFDAADSTTPKDNPSMSIIQLDDDLNGFTR